MSKRKSKPKVWPPVPVSGQPFDGGERPFGSGRLFDNHTHLPLLPGEYVSDSSGVRLSAEEQMERAVQSGVQRVVVSLCSLPEVQVLGDDRERFSGSAFEMVRFAVAIHPNDAPRHLGILDTAPDNVAQTREPWQETPLDDALAAVERAAREFPEAVVAIGETGLDYFRTAETGKEAQKQAFAAHIELAKALDLPLQIHDRDAHQDCVEMLRHCGAPRKTVFHCFSGDSELAEILAENGWYASFAGNVTYHANQDIQAGALAMPAHLRLIETDAPYLTPQPYRGQPNASYLIGHTADFLAELTQVTSEELREHTYRNATTVYEF